MLYPDLIKLLNPGAPLLLLAQRIPWERFERDFASLYAERGRPEKPIRLMVGLLLLKQMDNLSDELPGARKADRNDELMRYQRVVNQQRTDKKKIYSLHEPDVSCIGKGKEHKKYEFGAKAAIVMTKTNCIVVGAKNFSHNEYDGATLDSVLEQVQEVLGIAPETAFCDRGFRG